MFKEKIFLENFKVSIFKNKNSIYLYVYNNTYYTLLKFSKKIELKLKTDKCLYIIHNNTKTPLWEKIKLYLLQFYFYKFAKIKFTGKGYKIKKNTNRSLVLLFNRAHTTTLWWKNIILKKLKKYKIYVKYNHKFENVINTILNVRYINIFTKKGLRKSRQIVMKKKGKK